MDMEETLSAQEAPQYTNFMQKFAKLSYQNLKLIQESEFELTNNDDKRQWKHKVKSTIILEDQQSNCSYYEGGGGSNGVFLPPSKPMKFSSNLSEFSVETKRSRKYL